MSFTAFVAFESDGEYDLHYSHNGGDEYILYDALKAWVKRTDAKRDVFTIPAGLTSSAANLGSLLQGAGAKVKQNDSAPLIDPDPTETGLDQKEVFAAVRTYDTEVVYVVSDEGVETFVPVNPSPHAFSLMREHVKLDMYRFETQHQLQYLIQNRDDLSPITFHGDAFAPEKINETPDWAQNALEYAHRYVLNNIARLTKSESDTGIISGGVTVLDDVLMDMKITSAETAHPAAVDDFGIPVRVTWNNDVPSYPVYFSDGNYGARPKTVASSLRFEAHCDQQGSISEQSDYILDGIIDEFHDDIPQEYTPNAFSNRLAAPNQ